MGRVNHVRSLADAMHMHTHAPHLPFTWSFHAKPSLQRVHSTHFSKVGHSRCDGRIYIFTSENYSLKYALVCMIIVGTHDTDLHGKKLLVCNSFMWCDRWLSQICQQAPGNILYHREGAVYHLCLSEKRNPRATPRTRERIWALAWLNSNSCQE